MHLRLLKITRLFNQFTHEIVFPSLDEQEPHPSIVILHGPNGIGKTTILRMLGGLLSLNFNPFRKVPFVSCELQFSTGESIKVEPLRNDVSPSPLEVSFRDFKILLSGKTPGPLDQDEESKVEEFRKSFFAATEELTFDLIDTARFARSIYLDESTLEAAGIMPEQVRILLRKSIRNPKARDYDEEVKLAIKVRRFINAAQLNYRTFFTSRDPDLLPRILQQILDTTKTTYEQSDLLARLDVIQSKEIEMKRFGLAPDILDYSSVSNLFTNVNLQHRTDSSAVLSVLGTYVEMLEARLAERELLAERLRRFEELMKSFLIGKYVTVDSKKGLLIVTKSGTELTEDQLSSGEYHLLYLMVAALTTRRRGTIIAIDEPEMSMHLSWQRKLVSALVKCASGAEPQFLFATHSPDIAAEYPLSLIQLAPKWSE